MKKRLFCLIVIFVFVTFVEAQTKADEAMVRNIPYAFTAAWAKHDGHALANIMAGDVDFVNVGGDWLHGRADFELYHTRLLSGPFKQSLLKVLEIRVSFLRPDLAVLHWTWSIKGDGLEDPVTHEPRKGIFTMIAEKKAGDWLVEVAQNTDEIRGVNPELQGIKPPIVFPATR
jgi:uncharacterized protein (TIGR02246 family)